MEIKKIRFLEPGNLPYRPSLKNLYVYDKYIRTPSVGLLTLATVVKEQYDDVLMYSESISKVKWKDVLDGHYPPQFPRGRGDGRAARLHEFPRSL